MSVHALPRLTQASIPLTQAVEVTDERGHRIVVRVPAERALTIYLDRVEVVTLMTLGEHPEWLVLGYLLNQRLIDSVTDVDSITVDWETAAAGVRTRAESSHSAERTSSRIVTTGCGQGSMFSDLLDRLEPLDQQQPPLRRATLAAIVEAIRQRDTLYKAAGSVHGCALFEGSTLRVFIEDVGRHNALDSIAGWRALQASRPPLSAARTPPQHSDDRCLPVLYTTGRLTSEMIIKAAQMGVPVVVSRSGTTEMAIEVAERHRVCAIGRALNRRFLCYTHPWRIAFDDPPLESQGPHP